MADWSGRGSGTSGIGFEAPLTPTLSPKGARGPFATVDAFRQMRDRESHRGDTRSPRPLGGEGLGEGVGDAGHTGGVGARRAGAAAPANWRPRPALSRSTPAGWEPVLEAAKTRVRKYSLILTARCPIYHVMVAVRMLD